MSILMGGQPLIVDNTMLSAYMTCPREFFFSMVLHRRAKEEKAALSFGGAWHKALEIWYKGGTLQDVTMGVLSAWRPHEGEGNDYRTVERLLLDFQKYIKNWGDADRETTLGWSEGRPLVEVSTAIESDEFAIPYAGRLDRVQEESKLTYVEDHKTTSRFDKNYFSQFTLSNQMLGYTWMAQKLLPEKRVLGVRINLSHVLKDSTEFHRRTFNFPADRIKEWERNTSFWISRLYYDYLMWGIGQGKSVEELGINQNIADELLSRSDPAAAFPAHYGDNGCSRKFGLCQYHPVCSVSPRMRQKVLEMEFKMRPWNPLEIEDD